MKHINLYEYFNDFESDLKYEEEYKNELIRLNTRYSQKLSAQVMVDWLTASIDILKAKSDKEKINK